MEPNTQTIQRRGDLGGVKVDMKIDENSLAHIMALLTDLYSDPEMAVLREYSTNAWDAHIEAGTKRPIEVTLPTLNSPFLVVKDYGVGLSVDDITTIYSLYGASTKRGTNDQVGMLGLGCKSALTYTNQFSIVSVKNGVRVSVSVSRVEDGTGVMEIVDTRSTSEPNGVEIRVPAKQNNYFARKAERFYKYWDAGSVLVDGVAPDRVNGAEVSPNIFMVENADTDYVVMGNVPYPLESRVYHPNYQARFGVVAFVGIGEVDFTPSREALQYTKRTNQTIDRIKREFVAGLERRVQSEVTAATTKSLALAAYIKWENLLSSYNMPKNLHYKGQEIPKLFQGRFIQYEPHRQRNSVGTYNQLTIGTLRKSIIVTDFPSPALNAGQKAKLREYGRQNSKNNTYYILCDKVFGDGWLTDVEHVTWDTVKATKMPANSRYARTSDVPQYDVWDSVKGYFNRQDAPTTAGNYYYCSSADKIEHSVFTLLTELDASAIIVMLNQNRWDKFKRDYPTAKRVTEAIKVKYTEARDALTETDKFVLNTPSYESNTAMALKGFVIDDPEVASYVNALNGGAKSNTLSVYEKWYRVMRNANQYLSHPDAKRENPLRKYPLIDGGSVACRNAKDAVLYINAKYASTKGI